MGSYGPELGLKKYELVTTLGLKSFSIRHVLLSAEFKKDLSRTITIQRDMSKVSHFRIH